MKFWVGVTDNRWYEFLAQRDFDEVNFWQPSAKPLFVDGSSGMPFLFKLKRPHNHIAGGGFFLGTSTLPLSLAWEVFGQKNGAASLEEFRSLIEPLMKTRNRDPEIGCTLLANPFFISAFDWIKDPPSWAGSIVRGKTYDSTAEDGSQIWAKVAHHFVHDANAQALNEERMDALLSQDDSKFGEPKLVKPRLGQSSFRVLVTDAYKRRCAMTGESTLVVLEAAHIVPYSGVGTHDISNGILLRSDFHRLFDKGLVSITADYKIKVSPRIREAWFNGKAYYRLDDQALTVIPDAVHAKPDRDRLDWHFRNVFQG
ncbi:MAG: HNH endonuclease [Ramlibacter sp.]